MANNLIYLRTFKLDTIGRIEENNFSKLNTNKFYSIIYILYTFHQRLTQLFICNKYNFVSFKEILRINCSNLTELNIRID